MPPTSLVRPGKAPAPGAPPATGRGRVLRDRRARQVTYLRLSLTERCNQRCTYCMPEGGLAKVPRDEVLTFEEIERLVTTFVGWGVRAVRLTGGEPLVRRGVVSLVERLAALELPAGGRLRVALSTNAELLPALAEPLARAGLAAVNVSLDSLRPDRYRAITRRGHLDRALAGLRAAGEAGIAVRKTNTVAIDGFNDDELADIVRLAWSEGATPRFIELMPMAGGSMFVPGQLLPAARIRQILARELGAELMAVDRPMPGMGPARYWAVEPPGGATPRAIGIISAMTENFCDGCNRMRISSTGQLHACLGHDAAVDLRAAVRSADPSRLEEAVHAALAAKPDGHRFSPDGGGGPRKAMVSIGG